MVWRSKHRGIIGFILFIPPTVTVLLLLLLLARERKEVSQEINEVLVLERAPKSFDSSNRRLWASQESPKSQNSAGSKPLETESFNPTKLRNNGNRLYRLQFEKHRAIKIYLNAPCRRYSEYQGVLITLLENGYGIREWPDAIRAISSWSQLEHHNTEQLQLLGITNEHIPRERQRFRKENIGEWKRYRAMLKANTGISDVNLLDTLMNRPLYWPYYSDPLRTKDIAFHQGEALLNDNDWMEPVHREAMKRHQGTQREPQTKRELAEKWRDEPLLENEHETVIDRVDIHPALKPYRGDAFYEHKRSLHELGAKRVKEMKTRRERGETPLRP